MLDAVQAFSGLPFVTMSSFNYLQTLYCSRNYLKRLDGIELLANLASISLCRNGICSLDSIRPLQKLSQLKMLGLEENPVCIIPFYRSRVLNLLPSLIILDGKSVSRGEKELAPYYCCVVEILLKVGVHAACLIHKLGKALQLKRLNEEFLTFVSTYEGIKDQSDRYNVVNIVAMWKYEENLNDAERSAIEKAIEEEVGRRIYLESASQTDSLLIWQKVLLMQLESIKLLAKSLLESQDIASSFHSMSKESRILGEKSITKSNSDTFGNDYLMALPSEPENNLENPFEALEIQLSKISKIGCPESYSYEQFSKHIHNWYDEVLALFSWLLAALASGTDSTQTQTYQDDFALCSKKHNLDPEADKETFIYEQSGVAWCIRAAHRANNHENKQAWKMPIDQKLPGCLGKLKKHQLQQPKIMVDDMLASEIPSNSDEYFLLQNIEVEDAPATIRTHEEDHVADENAIKTLTEQLQEARDRAEELESILEIAKLESEVTIRHKDADIDHLNKEKGMMEAQLLQLTDELKSERYHFKSACDHIENLTQQLLELQNTNHELNKAFQNNDKVKIKIKILFEKEMIAEKKRAGILSKELDACREALLCYQKSENQIGRQILQLWVKYSKQKHHLRRCESLVRNSTEMSAKRSLLQTWKEAVHRLRGCKELQFFKARNLQCRIFQAWRRAVHVVALNRQMNHIADKFFSVRIVQKTFIKWRKRSRIEQIVNTMARNKAEQDYREISHVCLTSWRNSSASSRASRLSLLTILDIQLKYTKIRHALCAWRQQLSIARNEREVEKWIIANCKMRKASSVFQIWRTFVHTSKYVSALELLNFHKRRKNVLSCTFGEWRRYTMGERLARNIEKANQQILAEKADRAARARMTRYVKYLLHKWRHHVMQQRINKIAPITFEKYHAKKLKKSSFWHWRLFISRIACEKMESNFSVSIDALENALNSLETSNRMQTSNAFVSLQCMGEVKKYERELSRKANQLESLQKQLQDSQCSLHIQSNKSRMLELKNCIMDSMQHETLYIAGKALSNLQLLANERENALAAEDMMLRKYKSIADFAEKEREQACDRAAVAEASLSEAHNIANNSVQVAAKAQATYDQLYRMLLQLQDEKMTVEQQLEKSMEALDTSSMENCKLFREIEALKERLELEMSCRERLEQQQELSEFEIKAASRREKRLTSLLETLDMRQYG